MKHQSFLYKGSSPAFIFWKIAMFDARNKNQPKLVFSHHASSPSEPPRRDDRKTSVNTMSSSSTRGNSAARVSDDSNKQKVNEQAANQVLIFSSNRQQQQQKEQQQPQPAQTHLLKVQQGLSQNTSQVNHQQQRKISAQQQEKPQQSAQVQPTKSTVFGVISVKKEPGITEITPQNGFLKTLAVEAASKANKDSAKEKSQVPQSASDNNNNKSKSNAAKANNNNTKADHLEGYNIYRGRTGEVNNESKGLAQNSDTSTMASASNKTDAMRKISTSSTSSHRSVTQQSSDPGYAAALRHSTREGGSVKPRPLHQVQSSHNQHLYQQQPLSHQYHQQHLHLQQPQSQHRNSEYEQGVLRNQYKESTSYASQPRVQSYPQGRQQNLQNSSNNPLKTGQGQMTMPFTIPRVTASATARPQAQTLSASTRSTDSSNMSYLHPGEPNRHASPKGSPSGSPRSVKRPSYRLDPDRLSPQPPANPPKSILKNNLALEQSDLYLSTRPLLLPRAKGEKDYTQREYDFSSILTANKGSFTAVRVPTSIKVEGQVQSLPSTSTASSSLGGSRRPVTAGAPLTKFELNQEGSPQKKSVTFNSHVRLHTDDDDVSMMRSLAIDAHN